MTELNSTFALCLLLCGTIAHARTPARPRPAATNPAAANPAAPPSTALAHTAKGITRADLVKRADTILKFNKPAIIASVSDYTQADPQLSNLMFTINDMISMKIALEAQGFTVIALQNAKATATKILDNLRGLATVVDKPEDTTVVFYFSGHGFANGDDNYLATYGSTFGELPKQGLAMHEVKQLLNETDAAQRMAFIDVCRRDPQQKHVGLNCSTDNSTSPSGTRVLFSTTPGWFSDEEPTLRLGRFTHFLVRGLQGEAAMDDGFISWNDLKNFMLANMRRYSMKDLTRVQIPCSNDDSSGDLLIGKRLGPIALPAAAMGSPMAVPAPRASTPLHPASITHNSLAAIHRAGA